MKDFEEYYAQRVKLIVDRREYNEADRSSRAKGLLEIEATICGETDKFLRLTNINILNRTRHENFFAYANINKNCIDKGNIVGVFESSKK